MANLDQIQNNLSLIQDHQSQITANNIAIGNETTRAEVAEQGLARSKVDITDYNIDQQQQADLNTKTDKELDDHAYQLRLLDSRSQGLQAAIVSHGDRMNAIQSDVDSNAANITGNTNAINNESDRAKAAETDLDRNKVNIADYNIDQSKQDTVNKAATKELADHDYNLRLLNSKTIGLQDSIVSHGDRMNAIQSDVANNAANITGNTNAINNESDRAKAAETDLDRNKVNIADYNIDQSKQDTVNKAATKELADHDYNLRLLNSKATGLQDAIVSHGDRMNAIQSDVDNDTAKINKETTDRSAADQRQQQQITNNTNATRTNAGAITANQKTIANNKTSIDRLSGQNGTTYKLAAATARLSIHEEQQIVTLAQDTKVAQATGEYAQSRAQIAMQNAEKNRAALVASNKKIAANSVALADHEQRIETLEQSNSSNFGKLKSEVDENRKRASAGIAGVAAMANIPQVTNTQNFSVGAGVGNTDGENALAVGFSARATENVVVKASVSDDSQHNFVVGGGIAYGW
ncbi:YadA C-terminal domain-containing protein [Enterobacter huaxiensis]|uniref:YadA C-terminal domain-containing protein n=1 Tax=Enterobacter huaxiensis TaxID=2494702 RepID=UPI0021DB564E|nr:YadA-like family protein [Enterobacter huaxiensis]